MASNGVCRKGEVSECICGLHAQAVLPVYGSGLRGRLPGKRHQKKSGRRLGQIIVSKGWVAEDVFLSILGKQLSIPYVVMRKGLVDPMVFDKLDIDISQRLRVIPMFMVHGELTLATTDPQAIASFSEIEEKLNCKVRPVLVRRNDIVKTLNEAGSDNIYGAEII